MNSFERLSNNELQQVNSFWLTQVTEIVERRQLAAYTQVLWDGLREEQHREFTDFMMVI